MPGCRSKEGSGDRRQAARASSKLTLEDIRSGAAARPPGSPDPAREPAAAPGRTLSAPIVQPETPFANASVQVLFSFQAWSGEQSVQDPLTNARVSLPFLHGLLSEIVVWEASPLPLCFLYGQEALSGGVPSREVGWHSQGFTEWIVCRTMRRQAETLQRTNREAR